jgi:hypothetical protein
MNCIRLLAICFSIAIPLAAQGVDMVFALETSVGTEQAIGLIRARDLKEPDRAAVITFQRSAQTLQSLTANRDDIARALQRAGTRVTVGIGPGGLGVPISAGIDLTGAIREACREFDENKDSKRKRAILVLFANEDHGLGGNLENIRSLLKDADARLFAVAITRVASAAFPSRPGVVTYPFPAATVRLLTPIVKESGGRLFPAAWDFKSILAEARKP